MLKYLHGCLHKADGRNGLLVLPSECTLSYSIAILFPAFKNFALTLRRFAHNELGHNDGNIYAMIVRG